MIRVIARVAGHRRSGCAWARQLLNQWQGRPPRTVTESRTLGACPVSLFTWQLPPPGVYLAEANHLSGWGELLLAPAQASHRN